MVTQSFWKSLLVIATVIGGVFYIEDRLEKTIEKNMKPVIDKVDLHETRLALIEKKNNVFRFEYRIATSETNKLIDFINKRFNTSFIKPSEINIQEEK